MILEHIREPLNELNTFKKRYKNDLQFKKAFYVFKIMFYR